MKRVKGLCVLIAGAAVAMSATAYAAEETPSDQMFGRLQALVGSWEGTFEWSGARKAKGTLKATYSLTANGSALVENLIMGETQVPSMTSVYHLDGADLRMTHYCAARNQPRLKATHIDVAKGVADFGFVDVTNVGAANPGYVDAFEVQILDTNQIHLRFDFGGGGPKAVEDISLRRAKAVAG
jgi:hypothetical protein